jgi:hypothetical protein
VVGSSVAMQPALPRGRSRGRELGQERGLTGGSQSLAAEAHARERLELDAELGRRKENGPRPFSDF